MNTLRYAVRIPTVLKFFGQLCLVLAAMTLVPLFVSLFFEDYRVSLRYAALIPGVAALGWGLNRFRAARRIQANEAMVTTALIFLFTPLIMTWPMMASGLGFADAFFETVSGVTTTGLSAGVTDAALHPFLKGVLGVGMLLGRLEIIAWLVLLTPATWFGNRLED